MEAASFIRLTQIVCRLKAESEKNSSKCYQICGDMYFQHKERELRSNMLDLIFIPGRALERFVPSTKRLHQAVSSNIFNVTPTERKSDQQILKERVLPVQTSQLKMPEYSGTPLYVLSPRMSKGNCQNFTIELTEAQDVTWLIWRFREVLFLECQRIINLFQDDILFLQILKGCHCKTETKKSQIKHNLSNLRLRTEIFEFQLASQGKD